MNLNVPNDPNYWLKRAEEAWSVADQMTDAHTKAIMVGIAQSYEKITEWTEQHPREQNNRPPLPAAVREKDGGE